MAKVQFKNMDTEFMAEGSDALVMAALDKLKKKGEDEKVIARPEKQPVSGAEWDVVAIYDNAGIPSIMHRFRKITNKELFGGSDKTAGAFVIGGEEYDEIYISVYPNCNINGKPYSLPYQKPWTNITNDAAAEACFSKGEGWHLMTAQEWGLLANLSKKKGTLPHGNTNSRKYHADPEEKGETYNNYYTLTGSGPATWTHDHMTEGVHDLCGNIWEMVRGLRIRNGKLQMVRDNNAALNFEVDLTAEGDDWEDVTDDNGKPIYISVSDEGGITISTDSEREQGYDGAVWEDVNIDAESETLKELALYAGEPHAYFYADSTDGEYFPIRGGSWSSGAVAGVFVTYLSYPRSHSYGAFGFRSAFLRNTEN
ncbi:Sulfatase-modifying factor enzyme 1 [Fusobacterium naviforme]|nr:hypothetical protein F7P78_06380 [Fusobacterium naviforme]PSL10215.1 Sulfatase-modifying factor enzyme 1 [Fusobacterium naviforme]STO27625.1 Uncharacterised protein [Fusobacterium naviforme]